MPEMPEVEALARWLDERTSGLSVERVDVLAISALKTFDPPVDELLGRPVRGWSRAGKFLILSTGQPSEGPVFLCIHLARAGWLRWSEEQKTAPVKLGRGPGAL